MRYSAQSRGNPGTDRTRRASGEWLSKYFSIFFQSARLKYLRQRIVVGSGISPLRHAYTREYREMPSVSMTSPIGIINISPN